MLEQRESLDRVFRALADPSRRAMVEQLVRGPMSVSQLAEPLAMTLAGVVQHVQVLETGGIVRSKKRGRVRICWIDPAALGDPSFGARVSASSVTHATFEVERRYPVAPTLAFTARSDQAANASVGATG